MAIAARIMMMAMTTISSISVNPFLFNSSSLEVSVGFLPVAGYCYVCSVDCNFA
jgi:hypothetical protein